MLKWLIFLGVALYGALLFGGEDRGQLRAGLREQPVLPDVAAVPEPETPAIAQVLDPPVDQVAEIAPAAVVQSLPQQPIRVLPAPELIAATAPVADIAVPDLPTETIAAEAPPPNTELRWISVERANVRNGPSRNASVTGRIEGGEAVLVLWVEENGWARIRVEGDGVDGFVHSSLLTDTDPQSE